MTYRMIEQSRDKWLAREDCPASQLIEYIEATGQMRDAQVDAIKTYLFLKMACGGQPLAKLYSNGTFNSINIDDLEINAHARNAMRKDPSIAALYEYLSDSEVDARAALEVIKTQPDAINPAKLFNEIFYKTEYTDYIFSLPMGAGKTFLMAAFIYIDLYYSSNDPTNEAFARNFIVFAPSGLKSSVVPSLKTIQAFNPSWIIPEPAASELKAFLRFEILDEQKSSKKSNLVKNPNAHKVATHQPFETLHGLVMVTNAEKVILDKVSTDDTGEIRLFTDEEMDEATRRENELRRLIGKIPGLAVIIDEAHHAQSDDIKLRAVVNKWAAENDNVNCVLGFSGTPFLKAKAKFEITEGIGFKSSFMSNVVHYYPLAMGIGNFLKVPTVEIVDGTSEEIIAEGVNAFLDEYGSKVYKNKTLPKLAIFCGSVTKLEETVFPLVFRILSDRNMDPDKCILKYHRGGTGKNKYPTLSEWTLQFSILDDPISEKRIVLLAQIGKEGWDCRSLAGVILSQEGDCSQNMVLQTSCRCLREVVKGETETALIVLNDKNAGHLQRQLAQTQRIDLETFQGGVRRDGVTRLSRVSKLNLPNIAHYSFQLGREVRMDSLSLETIESDLYAIPDKIKKLIEIQTIEGLDFSQSEVKYRSIIASNRGLPISYRRWKHALLHEAGAVDNALIEYSSSPEGEEVLSNLFEKTTLEEGGQRFESSAFDQVAIKSAVRALFYPERSVKTDLEEVGHLSYASFVNESKLTPVYGISRNEFYPDEKRTRDILDADNQTMSPETLKAYETLMASGQSMAAEAIKQSLESKLVDNAFQYIPYHFDSLYEKDFYETVLGLEETDKYGLEIYYNGDRSVADFRIECFKKNGSTWKKVGLYTPDFLVIQRDGERLKRVLIIETKGLGYKDEQGFVERRNFVKNVFVPKNNELFGDKHFEYCLLTDDTTGRDMRTALRAIFDDCFSDLQQ